MPERGKRLLAAKVAVLGGDPTKALHSPTGGDQPAPCREPEPCEVRSRDLWCMNIPWGECDIEGEVEVKLRKWVSYNYSRSTWRLTSFAIRASARGSPL